VFGVIACSNARASSKGDNPEARRERPEMPARARVSAEANETEGASVEVIRADDELRLSVRARPSPHSPIFARP
jgi:hypothetical protein